MSTHRSWFDDVSRIARQAGQLAFERFCARGDLIEKGLGDWASAADLEVEEFIKARLLAIAPQSQIIGEESASAGTDASGISTEASPAGGFHRNTHANSGVRYVWHVDPIDGSANFVKGIAHFATVISLTEVHENGEQKIVLGITYDPCRDEFFSTLDNEPTQLNGKNQKVSNETEPLRALLSVVTPKPNAAYMQDFGRWFTHQMQQFGGIRRSGAMALDLAWVSCGRLQAFAGVNLAPWDIGAGLLHVRNAGGVHDMCKASWSNPALSPVAETFCFAANSNPLLQKLRGDTPNV